MTYRRAGRNFLVTDPLGRESESRILFGAAPPSSSA